MLNLLAYSVTTFYLPVTIIWLTKLSIGLAKKLNTQHKQKMDSLVRFGSSRFKRKSAELVEKSLTNINIYLSFHS